MRYAILLTIVSICAFHNKSFAEDRFSAGGGLAYVPEYAGADKSRFVPLPFLERTWDNGVFASTRRGIGWGTVADGVSLSAALSYDGGREDHKKSYFSGSDALKGMGKIEGAAQAVLSAGYQLGDVGLSFSTNQNLSHREYGATYTLGGSMSLYAGAADQLGLGVSAQYGDRKHAQTWFGVTAEQSARSGYRQHTAGAGFETVTAGLNWMHTLDRNWSVLTMVGVTRLSGDAADSPLTKRKTTPMVVTGISYKF
ncbi:MipA/OmpV family protein [Duganella callida]|uniref:MipA/OmpV family protein n=1 Tax=Duganella callida TaxID=2561932 RepID=A0A4Y9S8N1_9BURK|nr:MipA/OmpV family protein [Duganella callida]TFW18001.1 MipA/OmpV family protein [Duganella callida]